jgi:predicted porin
MPLMSPPPTGATPHKNIDGDNRMKRLALAGFTIAAACSAAAQSSVTVFGAVDVYVGQAKGGPRSVTRMEDGGSAASRLGFRGIEDLGNGVDAHFMFEGGFAPDTGTGTLPAPSFQFTRQSFVGIGSKQWGAIDLGRMYTPMFYTLFRGDPFGLNTVVSPLNLVTATDAQPRLATFLGRGSNMVRYRTPTSLPWFADVAVAAGEGTLPRVLGFTGGWASGPAYLGYGIQTQALNGVKSTYQAVSGSYDFKIVKLYGNVIRNTVDVQTTPSATLLAVGALVPFGSSQVIVEATQRKVAGSDRGQTAWVAGYDYNLSKRTSLYARALHLSNDGGSGVSLAQIPITPNSGEKARLLAVGIRHFF